MLSVRGVKENMILALDPRPNVYLVYLVGYRSGIWFRNGTARAQLVLVYKILWICLGLGLQSRNGIRS